jgi:hypothetical protein
MGSQFPPESQSPSQKGGKPVQKSGPQSSQQARDSHTNSSRSGEESPPMPSDIRPNRPDGAEPDRAGK